MADPTADELAGAEFIPALTHGEIQLLLSLLQTDLRKVDMELARVRGEDYPM